jgi:glycosyltransferase involved in cell wall biosynthesis
MRLLFIADGRSPIARNWISHFAQSDHEVHLLSTFPCHLDFSLASVRTAFVAFSGAVGTARTGDARPVGGASGIAARAFLRHWLGPLTIPRAAKLVRTAIEEISPDLVHAMRIPYEGMLAATADPPVPLLISVWGNDFTLHANASPGMVWFTRRAMKRADALHTDCRRDIGIARQWGFSDGEPVIVLPGGGGVRTDVFFPGEPDIGNIQGETAEILHAIPEGAPVVINPRGFRAYVRNDTFFQAIPRILDAYPETIFLCPTMAGERQALAWIERLGIRTSVRLLPKLTPVEMAMAYRRSQVTVSPSEHDGTPNTLLEAMACGCFPVAGDLESIREWIENKVNGLLVDPAEPAELADAVVQSLSNPELRAKGMERNLQLIRERATRELVMKQAEDAYRQLVG